MMLTLTLVDTGSKIVSFTCNLILRYSKEEPLMPDRDLTQSK